MYKRQDYGADLLRLWVASADYTQDMRISKEIMKQLSDAYLKIRNTARYMLGSLNGFNPDTDAVAYADLMDLDKWALSRLNELSRTVRNFYNKYEFHGVYRSLYNFCVVDLSNFYFDIIKDRLYCGDEAGRRSAQTALYRILDGMTRLVAPILAFTSEEIWQAMPHDKTADAECVLFNEMPDFDEALALPQDQAARWDAAMALRTDVNKALEIARGEKRIGKSLEAAVTLYFDGDEAQALWRGPLGGFDTHDLETICIVSHVDAVIGSGEGYKGEAVPGLTVQVEQASGAKCARCWMYNEHVGEDHDHPELCPRCAAVEMCIRDRDT